MVNTTITTVCVHLNRDLAGVVAIARSIKANSTIRTIDLRGDRLDAMGVAALGDALTVNTSVSSLGILVDECGACALADVMKLNSRITDLALCGDGIFDNAGENFES